MNNKQRESYKTELLKKWFGGFVFGLVVGGLVGWVLESIYYFNLIK